MDALPCHKYYCMPSVGRLCIMLLSVDTFAGAVLFTRQLGTLLRCHNAIRFCLCFISLDLPLLAFEAARLGRGQGSALYAVAYSFLLIVLPLGNAWSGGLRRCSHSSKSDEQADNYCFLHGFPLRVVFVYVVLSSYSALSTHKRYAR